MTVRKCQECRQPFPVPQEHLDQTTCFSCYHWAKACQWIDKTISIQKDHHPQIFAFIEEEYRTAKDDFQRSIVLKEWPLVRAPIPIRVVRLEIRIIAANIDRICEKMGDPPLGSELLAQCEAKVLGALGQRPSMAWRTVCTWRMTIFDSLRHTREKKRLYDARREQKIEA